MGKNIIISIGRQFGAGGRRIGKALAEALNFDYYDNELITATAKECGLDPEFFKKADEKSEKNYFLQQIEEYISGGFFTNSLLSNDQLFKLQSDTIRKLAEEKPCVIVGRCSDYVLRDNPYCISIFLHSSDEDRIERIKKRMEGVSDDEITDMMKLADKRRAHYYNFYSNKTWGMSSTYTLSVDVSALGEKQTIDFLLAFIKQKAHQLGVDL
ncbi:MAG: cytidylate kinase-like family protein [Paludibacteraceae bacterium]|nr:cytidylate kinase-like family protein [Paludibacteraceae bacterium]